MTARQFLDLTVTAVLAMLALAAMLVVGPSPVTLLIALPLLLLLPGFAIVSAIYPAAGQDDIGGIARFALSIAISIAVTPMVAMAANYTVGVHPLPVVLGVAAVTVSMCFIAAGRRASVPAETRAGATPFSHASTVFERYFRGTRSLKSTAPLEATSGADVFLNLIIVGTILVFAASVGFAALIPQDEGVTETYLATTTGDSVTLVQNTEGLSQEDRNSLIAVVENEEGTTMQYSVVIESGGNVLADESATLNNGDTWRINVPQGDGDRTVVKIYHGDADGEPDYRLVLQEP